MKPQDHLTGRPDVYSGVPVVPRPEEHADPGAPDVEPVPSVVDTAVPVLRETTEAEVYIDRGHPLPDNYPGPRLRVMVRDPASIFVYWEMPEITDAEAWEVVAVDLAGEVIDSFRVGREGSSGYLRVSSDLVGKVILRALRHAAPSDPLGVIEFGTPRSEPSIIQNAPFVAIDERSFEERRQHLITTHAIIGRPPGEPQVPSPIFQRQVGPSPVSLPAPLPAPSEGESALVPESPYRIPRPHIVSSEPA